MRPRFCILVLLAPAHLPARKPAPADADVGTLLSSAHHALKKGFHQKAFDHYRTVHRSLSSEAYEHAELQEGLCVCAARLRKEKVAISACGNASALRERSSSPSPPPLPLLMAQGEAQLFASEPLAARSTFRAALRAAEAGEAFRLEKEARDAVRRAEGRLFVSFSRQRGAIVHGTALRTSSFASLTDALQACAAERWCKALSANLLTASKANAKVVRVTLYNSTIVSSDAEQPPSARSMSYVRDAPEHGYASFPASTLDLKLYPRSTPAGATSGELFTVARAMLLCDANADKGGANACAGFVVQDEAEEVEPGVAYRIEFRMRKGAASLGTAAEPPSAAVRPATGKIAFAREKPAELKQPEPPQHTHIPRQPPPGGRAGGGGGGGGNPFGGGGGPFGSGGGFGGFGGGGFNFGGGGGGGGGGGRGPPPAKPSRDYYAILKVPKDASARAIKKAYHSRAREWHPDKNPVEAGAARAKKADRNFKLIARAYEVLSDRATREAYDRGENVDDPKWRASGPFG